jgi:hypothetical protein
MNNEFNTVINYLKGLLIADPDINVVTHGTSNDIDMDKKTNYPLGHIQFLSFNPNYAMGVMSFTFDVYILNIRDTSKITSTDKWLRNDNELSNYNKAVAIANRLFYSLNDINANDIEVASQTNPEAISLQFLNMLDGCSFQLELSITNSYDPCDE